MGLVAEDFQSSGPTDKFSECRFVGTTVDEVECLDTLRMNARIILPLHWFPVIEVLQSDSGDIW